MLRLFVDQGLRRSAELALAPGPARHVQVRRLQPGDALVLFNGSGGEWHASITVMTRQAVQVRVQAFDPVERELPLAVTLAVGMPANERMDFVVEKATELGVNTLQPLHCERAVLRLAGERAERKREHWQALAVAASEQSGRTRVPRVQAVRPLQQWLSELPAADARWVLSPGAAQRMLVPRPGAVIQLLSGPEGGLTAGEQDSASAAGFVACQLGPRVLRADTAPLAALAWLALS